MRRRQAIAALAGAALALLLASWLWPASTPPGPPSPPGPASARRGPASAEGPPGPGLVASGPAPAGSPAPRGAFEGSVLSRRSGTGIPGAEVTFSRGGAAASVRCGADGSFRFEPPEPGRWQLAAASAPGHVPFAPEWGHSPVVFDARPGERVSGVTVWLRPESRYEGQVQDPDGKPVEGAEVRLLGGSTGERALLPSTDRAVSRAGGAFAIAASEGAIPEPRHPGFAPGRASIDFTARASRRVVVRLGKVGAAAAFAAITGRVTSSGAPVDGALVSARLLRRGGPGSIDDGVSAQATSDAEGRFTLRELDEGRYLLTGAREGFAQPRPVVARTGEEAAIDLSRGGRIDGMVREASSGRPVAPFRIV